MEMLIYLNSRGFVKNLQETGEVYLVGGIVRDHYLKKESKDIDLIVTGIPIEDVIKLIEPFGKVDYVGKSFGVLKFRPEGLKTEIEDIDIAIPRTERKIGSGHQGFEINADHTLSIEEDLIRRDFTLNAMAVKLRDGSLVDPFGGLEAIERKEIRIVNPIAFSEDPLRMARAVQFASRFGFKIESETFQMISDNAHLIKEISGERILIELDKIFAKGDHEDGFRLLVDSGLYKQIFGFDAKAEAWFQMKNRSDFYFHLLKGSENRSETYLKLLRGDQDTAEAMEALEMMSHKNPYELQPWEIRMILFRMYKKSKNSLLTEVAPLPIRNYLGDLLGGLFPASLKKLEINGDDLLRLGFKGRAIGETLDLMIEKIMKEELSNDRTQLLNFAAECSKPQES